LRKKKISLKAGVVSHYKVPSSPNQKCSAARWKRMVRVLALKMSFLS